MHLTNYSITKKDPDDLDLDSSKRRSLQQLFYYLKRDNHDVEKLWTEIKVNTPSIQQNNSFSRFSLRILLLKQSFLLSHICHLHIERVVQQLYQQAKVCALNCLVSIF